MSSPRFLLPLLAVLLLAVAAFFLLEPLGESAEDARSEAERVRAEAAAIFEQAGREGTARGAGVGDGAQRSGPGGVLAPMAGASFAEAGFDRVAGGPSEAGAPRPLRSSIGPPAGARKSRTWVGELRSSQGSGPVVAATVTLRLGDERSEATSDEAGRFALAWFEDLPADLEIEHPDHVDLRAAELPLEDDARFTLDPSAAIDGRLTGLPLALMSGDQRVELWQVTSKRGRDWPRLTAEVDATGSFQFTDLDPGEYALCAFGDGLAGRYEHGVVLAAGRRLQVDLGVERAASLVGELVFPPGLTGPSLAGAEIELVPRDKDLPKALADERERETTADASGRFELADLAPGAHRVLVTTPWGARKSFGLDIDSAGQELEKQYTLAVPASLAGRVVDASGGPLAGVTVVTCRQRSKSSLATALEGRGDELPGAVRTDADGVFLIETVPAGEPIFAFARPAGHLPVWSEPLVLGPAEARRGLELRLPEELFVSGRVEHASATGQVGEHLGGARLEARYSQSGRESVFATATSDEDGSYTLGPLMPGSMRIAVRLDGYLDGSQKLELLPGSGTTEASFQLDPAWSLSGRVVDEDGNGVERLRLVASVLDLDLPRSQRRERHADDPPDRAVHTDDYGRFTLRELPAADWFLAVRSEHHELIERTPRVVTSQGDEPLLVVRRLTRSERASLDLVIVSAATGMAPEDLVVGGLGNAQVTLDGSEVHASGIEAEPKRVLISAKGCAATYLDVEFFPGVNTDLGLVQLDPGARITIVVKGPGDKAEKKAKVRLLPRSVDEGGPTPAGGMASGDAAPPMTLKHIGDGKYRSEGVPFGEWRLRVSAGGMRTTTIDFTVEDLKRTKTVELQKKKQKGGSPAAR
ncbi:MAG: hypothetical protein P1V81_05090 [Planctomycetota bacterium]|nr:hypothetical protein [Planctomycetota bacterium]